MKIWTRLSPPTTPFDRSVPAERGPDGRLVLGGFRSAGAITPPTLLAHMRGFFTRNPYTWLVLVPTLLAAIYFLLIASPQYVSESRFTVKARQPGSVSMLSEALNSAGFRSANEDAVAVRDFLLSHDAVSGLRAQLPLVEIFRRPEADWWARHWFDNPPAERLLDYYRSMVSAVIDATTGITVVTVRSFRPDDSLAINRALLGLSEQLVNRLNARILEDTVRSARAELARAESRVTSATTAISEFRERERALDPSRSAAIAVDTIGRLEGAVAQARSELQALLAFARPNSPQVQNLQNRIDALQQQIVEERRRTAAPGQDGFTAQVAAFERLRLEAEFAGRQLTAVTANLERSLAEAQRQQMFIQRVVEPNLAERHRYPQRLLSIAYVFLGLTVVYGLGWLILAGMKEHAS